MARLAAMMPVAAVAIARAIAIHIAAALVMMRLGPIPIDIAVRAFAAFEQAFLPGTGSATATATAATTTPAATTATRALTALAVGAFGTRRAAAHVAFALSAACFAGNARSDRAGCDIAGGCGLRSHRSGRCD